MKEDMQQLRIIVRGRVQGVFFRATTQELAKKIGVKGTVKNLPDGTVEIIAQGASGAINELLESLSASSGPGRVDSIEKTTMESNVTFSNFTVLR